MDEVASYSREAASTRSSISGASGVSVLDWTEWIGTQAANAQAEAQAQPMLNATLIIPIDRVPPAFTRYLDQPAGSVTARAAPAKRGTRSAHLGEQPTPFNKPKVQGHPVLIEGERSQARSLSNAIPTHNM
ncbi:MAG: hypothetical protein AB7L28_09685 [Kofleriaceae bacterium]